MVFWFGILLLASHVRHIPSLTDCKESYFPRNSCCSCFDLLQLLFVFRIFTAAARVSTLYSCCTCFDFFLDEAGLPPSLISLISPSYIPPTQTDFSLPQHRTNQCMESVRWLHKLPESVAERGGGEGGGTGIFGSLIVSILKFLHST